MVKTSWCPRVNKISWRLRATTTWTFNLHVIRSCTFEAKFVCQLRQAIIFCAVMAAKRFQTRTEEEIEQLLHDKSSKSTNKATDNAVRTLRDFCREQNLDESFQELSTTDLNSLLRKFYTSTRKCDGSLYTKNSLMLIRYGIARYLQQEKGLKIIDNEAFSFLQLSIFRCNYRNEKAGEGEGKSPSWNN